jgi:hypothetical protein
MFKNNKLLKIIVSVFLIIALAVVSLYLYCFGPLLMEITFVRPSKPEIKHGEFPFELEYEYNGERFTINETIICDYEGISFSLEGGNSRNWTCYITNNNEYGQYYLDRDNHPSLHIQVPLNAEYYMGAPDADVEFSTPYIYFGDETTSTNYYEQDLMDVVGAKIISWKPSEPLEGNIK